MHTFETMHPLIEKLEQDFIAFKSNPVNIEAFFESNWVPSISLPKDELKAFFQKIYDWAKENKESRPRIFALSTYTMGFINFHSEKYDETLKLAAEAEKLFDELNDEDGVAICKCSYAGAYRALGNQELALKYFIDAFHQLNKTHTYTSFETICSYGIPSVYMEMKSYEKAIVAFKICLDISLKYKNRSFEMLSYACLGDAYHQLKQDEKAMEYFTMALEMGKSSDNPNFNSRVLADLGNFYFDNHDLEKSVACNKEALAIREELKMYGGAITNLLQLAKIDLLQSNADAAINTLDKALKYAEQIKVKLKIFQIHLLLSEIYESKGDLNKSFEHYKLYHRISEEVNREDGEIKLKRSELIFEAEQTKKENVIIKAQKKQIEKTNIELQKTIDELTLSKINRKAKAITTVIAIVLFIIEDSLLHFVIMPHTHHNFFISLGANFAVVFTIKPIEKLVEHYLLHRFVKLEKEYEVVGGD